MPDKPNPYRYGSLMTDPRMFFGRKKELDDLRARLRNMQSVSIVGLRRIGKSSLLYQLTQTLRDELGENYVTLYFDLHDARCRTVTEFVQLVTRKLNDQMGGILDVQDVTDMLSFTDVIERLSKSIRPIICLDEFEEFIEHPQEFGDDFLEALRSLGQQSKMAMVTASRKSLSDLIQAAGWGSPFDNIFTQIDLGLLEPDAAQALLREPFAKAELSLSPEDESLVEELAGRHPFFLQMACYHLYEIKTRLPDASADERAIEVRERFENEARARFDKLWGELDKYEKAALKVSVGRARSTDKTQKILERLSHLGLVEQVNGKWQIFSQAFSKEVAAYPTPSDVKKAIKKVTTPTRVEKPSLGQFLLFTGVAIVVVLIAALVASQLPSQSIIPTVILTAVVLVFALVGAGKLTGQDFLGLLKNLIGLGE